MRTARRNCEPNPRTAQMEKVSVQAASLGTGGDSRTIRESGGNEEILEETAKTSEKTARASRCRVLRTSCIRSAYVPRTPCARPRVRSTYACECRAHDPLVAVT